MGRGRVSIAFCYSGTTQPTLVVARRAYVVTRGPQDSMVFNPEDAEFIGMSTDSDHPNELLKYLQHQSPEVLTQVAQSVSGEIKQIIAHNVQGLVGVLPGEGFNVQVTTDRENLAGLLASAMMTGYFLRQMEQRMELEHTVLGSVMGTDDLDFDA